MVGWPAYELGYHPRLCKLFARAFLMRVCDRAFLAVGGGGRRVGVDVGGCNVKIVFAQQQHYHIKSGRGPHTHAHTFRGFTHSWDAK